METKDFEYKLVNVWYEMNDGSHQCEPLEIVEMNGVLIAFFILN